MFKGFKYRIYPTKDQEALISKHIGAVRFMYNLALETKQMAYAGNRVKLSCFDLNKQLTDLKKECVWLKEINSQSLQTPFRDLDNAFTKFFKGQNKFPKFKKKQKFGSFNVPQNIILRDNALIIPKFKEGINIVLHRTIQGKIKQATISRTATGKYFASILCDMGEELPTKKVVKERTTVGVDLGLKSFLVSSDGQHFDSPKFLRKAQSKLKYTQRKYSKYKGKRTRIKLAKIHEKVANQRKDFLYKVSSKLIKNHDSIAIENLNVGGMKQNHKLAMSVSDAGWHSFTEMLKYKADWYGKNILKIGRFEPSSKTCSCCGAINKDLTLKVREWTCSCGVTHDRDVNAAINIKNFALKNLSVGRRLKNHDELPTLVGVMTHEANR